MTTPVANATQCYLLHGLDTYRSRRALEGIKQRFLRSNNMVDLVQYDLEEVGHATLEQAFLTIPFLVTHRLFVLRRAFSAPKATLDALPHLLAQLPASTIVVFFEAKRCDQRLGLYQWLKKNAKVQEYSMPDESEQSRWAQEVANECGVRLAREALPLFQIGPDDDTGQVAQEIHKAAWYVLAQGRQEITLDDARSISSRQTEASAFRLGDALRDGSLSQLVTLYRQLESQDALLLSGLLGASIRTLAKLVVGLRQGGEGALLAQRTGMNPYVVRLSLATARRLTVRHIEASYRSLLKFDRRVKDGSWPPRLGLLLLIIRLHVTLKKS